MKSKTAQVPVQTSVQPNSLFNLTAVNRYFWSVNRPMTVLFWLMVITTVLGLIGMAVDPRTVLSQSNWAKTTKFSISLVFYTGTMLWIFGYDTLRPRLSRFILSASDYTLGVEMVLMIFQGARAIPMHFNNATPFDARLFNIMAVTIVFLWFVNALGVAVLAAQRVPSRAFAWSLRLGVDHRLAGHVGRLFDDNADTSPNGAARSRPTHRHDRRPYGGRAGRWAWASLIGLEHHTWRLAYCALCRSTWLAGDSVVGAFLDVATRGMADRTP